MKEFLYDPWIITIFSGIVVFYITNPKIKEKRQKKRILCANSKIIEYLKVYIVNNNIPNKEVINSIKASVAREYDVNFNDLLTIKSLFEELITDIIKNIYIPENIKNDYLKILQNYLTNNIEYKEETAIIHIPKYKKNNIYMTLLKKRDSLFDEIIYSGIPSVLVSISVYLTIYVREIKHNGLSGTFSLFSAVVATGMLPIFTLEIYFTIIKTIKKFWR